MSLRRSGGTPLARVRLVVAAWVGGTLLAGVLSAEAQGIRGVTRRTTTQEFQAPARQFFDAAGIPTAGGVAAGVSQGMAGTAQPQGQAQPYLATRPASGARPLLAGPNPGVARPYVLGSGVRTPGVTRSMPATAAAPAGTGVRPGAVPARRLPGTGSSLSVSASTNLPPVVPTHVVPR